MAYLTREQMYRALSRTLGTNADLVFKTLAAGSSPTAGQSEYQESFFADLGTTRGINEGWVLRDEGATNINAGLNSQIANIGDPQSGRRAGWKELLDDANVLLTDLIGSSREDVGSHSNPARLDPDSTAYDQSSGGLEPPVKAELQRFRAHYAPSNLIQNKKD